MILRAVAGDADAECAEVAQFDEEINVALLMPFAVRKRAKNPEVISAMLAVYGSVMQGRSVPC